MEKSTVVKIRYDISTNQYRVTIPREWVEKNKLKAGDNILLSDIKDELKQAQQKTSSNFINKFLEEYNKKPK